MNIRRRSKDPNFCLKPDQNFDITKEVHDDIGFLMLIDVYLGELQNIKSGKSSEDSYSRCEYIQQKTLGVLKNANANNDSVFINILRRSNLSFEDLAVFSAIILGNCVADSFVSRYFHSLYEDTDVDPFATESRSIEDAFILKDLLNLVYPEVSKNSELYVSRLVENDLVELRYPKNVKLKGNNLIIRVSNAIVDILSYFNDSGNEQSDVIKFSDIEECYKNYVDLLEERSIMEMINDLRSYLKVREQEGITPLKILLYGDDVYTIGIISRLIAYECKRSMLINDVRQMDLFSFLGPRRKDKRIYIDEKILKIGWISDYLLRLDMYKSSDFYNLHRGFERFEKLINRLHMPLIITSYSNEPAGIYKSDILKHNYRLFKVSKLSRDVQKKILSRLLNISNIPEKELDNCIPEDGLSLRGIEIISEVSKRESVTSGKEIDSNMIKEIAYRVTGSIKEDANIRIEDEEDSSDEESTVETNIVEEISDLILNDSVREKVDFLLYAIKNMSTLYENLSGSYSYGRGIKALFYGPPGTGKTLCARAIAKETEKGLITVSFNRLFSKFVGDTEKQIVRYFNIAERQNAILYVDECDSIIMSRDSLHLSWEFSFINTFLKEMEKFNGVLILSTNYEVVRDRAINRRVQFFVKFDNPDYNTRISLLKKFIPAKYQDKFNLEEIAKLEFTGGNLKNVWLKMAISMMKNEVVDTTVFIEALHEEILKDAVKNNINNNRVGF